MSVVAETTFPMKRLKHVVRLRRLRTSLAEDGAQPYVGLENIQPGTGRLLDDMTAEDSLALPGTDLGTSLSTGFERGDVLFGKLRPYLTKAWMADFRGRCTTESLVMEPFAIDARFLRNICLSPWFVSAVDASTFGSKMPRAEWDFIGNLPVPLPNPGRQTAISDYLDRETARLDALVAAHERLLELLAEKRKATVTEAVTHGLHVHNAHMKHDRVIKRLRFLVRRTLSEERQHILHGAEQATFLPMESIGEKGDLDCSVTRCIDEVRSGYTQFFEGDVLVAKITPCFENGKGAIVEGTLNGVGFGTTELHVLAPAKGIDARYLYYATISDHFRKLGEAAMFGAAGQKRVPEDFVRNYRVPVPSLDEQRAIADYLDLETARLDALVAKVQGGIALVEERRAALISAAVTGQVAVGNGAEGQLK